MEGHVYMWKNRRVSSRERGDTRVLPVREKKELDLTLAANTFVRYEESNHWKLGNIY